MLSTRQFPLALSKTIEALYKRFRTEVTKNQATISKSESADILLLKDNKDSKFYFRIYSPDYDQQKGALFYIEYAPHCDHNLTAVKVRVTESGVMGNYENWINLLNEFNQVDFSEEDIFERQYEQEFYDEFEIIDSDAETHPFDLNKQQFIFKLLDQIETKIIAEGTSNPILIEIAAETTDLKNNIQNLTKRAVIKRLSRIFAKLYKFSVKLFHDTIDVAKKEIIKEVLKGGVDKISDLTL